MPCNFAPMSGSPDRENDDESREGGPPDPPPSSSRLVALVCMTPLNPSLSMLPSRMASSNSSRPPSAGVLLRLRALLTQPIRLERRGYDWHFVFGPPKRQTGTRRAGDSAPRRRSA